MCALRQGDRLADTLMAREGASQDCSPARTEGPHGAERCCPAGICPVATLCMHLLVVLPGKH